MSMWNAENGRYARGLSLMAVTVREDVCWAEAAPIRAVHRRYTAGIREVRPRALSLWRFRADRITYRPGGDYGSCPSFEAPPVPGL